MEARRHCTCGPRNREKEKFPWGLLHGNLLLTYDVDTLAEVLQILTNVLAVEGVNLLAAVLGVDGYLDGLHAVESTVVSFALSADKFDDGVDVTFYSSYLSRVDVTVLALVVTLPLPPLM